jgi:(heptosyl)LPS beta-1,4-glucosyltransferase
MDRLVAIIITKDEEAHIADCIASVRQWVEAVIVFDSYSSDATCALARQAGAQVMQRAFDNYARQRQAALEATSAEWVLFVDADERVTPALGREVQQWVERGDMAGGWIPRRNFIVGYETRFGGFFPDYQLRLLRRSAVYYLLEREVHELAQVNGAEGRLTQPFLHYNYANWAQFHRKQRVYAAYEAKILAGRGIHPRPHNFVLQPLREFYRRYVTLQGWRDGWHGLRLALLLAWYYGFVPYWLLWKKG